jgi:hypothetical protein
MPVADELLLEMNSKTRGHTGRIVDFVLWCSRSIFSFLFFIYVMALVAC